MVVKSKKILIINNEKNANELGYTPRLESSIKEIEQAEIIVKHFSVINHKEIELLDPDFIILTGRANQHWEIGEILNSYIPKLDYMNKIEVPILGICAGLQLIAVFFDGKFGKMIDSEKNILEEGYIKHEIVKKDQIFESLNKNFDCFQQHRDEVKEIPNEFDLLATSDMCKVQAIKHQNLPIYGVQFHPEFYNKEFPDGKQILINFFKN